MTKQTKSVLSVILSLILAFTCSLAVFAAETRTPEDIANDAVFTQVTLGDGTNTVYISLPIEGEPEILKVSVVIKVSKLLTEMQNDYADEDYKLMSRAHITGELMMHMIAYCITKSVGGTEESSPMHGYYESAKIADLNIDESRVPAAFIEAVGTMTIATEYLFGLSEMLSK